MPSKMSKKRKLLKMIMRSYKLRLPQGLDLPIRLRPWFVGLTAIVLLCLALFGFTNLAQHWSFNDKALHFICFTFATAQFYFVLDVDEDVRHIFFWRHFSLGFAGVVCLLIGGIFSEFVQSLLPYKTFHWGDVIANLLGASLGLFIAYRLERYYRFRREVARLYQPLGESEAEEESEEELLPTHNQSKAAKLAPGSTKANSSKNPRLGNVWDSREDFDIGDASDSDSEDAQGRRKPTEPFTPQVGVSAST
ncbi:hypothetical protein M408DRAFT_330340 [Serendipita vermifera MAFF 305830]|uniref:VanZ-like domain-containing protein n=1 Tax=Serendipita vermifera MAFF 305830 TaxID=933852 RepID=A0A0C3AR09_SERVB|nr:hypothetical protein M408DRAFT_330340 [Serendipita vermifera MAFF 305830]